jgi:hypothetical protein
MSELTLDTPVSRTDDNLSSNLAGEEVVLNLQDGVYYGLNDVGARVWALLDTMGTPREICEALQAEYEIDRATLEADVLALLAEMEEGGLVESPSSAEAGKLG